MLGKMLAVMMALAPIHAMAADVSAADVRAYLDTKGGDAAVEKFFSCTGDENTFNGYEHVAAGSRAWVDVGLRVLPYTGGCERESMYDSLALAMPKAPELSLLLVVPSNTRVACLPVSIDEADKKKWAAHLARLEGALLKVKEPSLQQAKKLCLDEVKQMRKSLRGKRG